MVGGPPRSTLFPYTALFRSTASTASGSNCDPAAARTTCCAVATSYARRYGRSATRAPRASHTARSEEHTSELQSRQYLVCRLLLEKKTHSSNFRSILPLRLI